ncbi:efflux RND transporter periplasmic adaptor subunit [Halomonas sp. V046]|uniref:efflux RND transporter periplasmic adaptor subunit n=1 Tax=Halomonas sp. V046 TaxID=3459611 RepID=UPI004044D348
MNIFFSRSRPLVAAAAALLLAACGQDEAPQQGAGGDSQPPAKSVEVAELARQDIGLDKAYPSKLMSEEEVTLVARVTGFLEERKFEPGDLVEQGDSLYAIEPDLYQSTVEQREADLNSAQAELSRAERDANRFQQLAAQNSVSRQQVDQALADARVARASVAQAQAALNSAQIDLNYADVTAPVSGMISLSQINVGNLVSPGTELATITPLDPLEVRFQLPQRDAFELRRQLQDQHITDIQATLEVPALMGQDNGQLSGNLDFLGSRVDAGTSTVQAQATFPNPDGAVLPGQFVRVKIEGLTRYDVLAVPELALTQGLMGPQVFVLDDDNIARARPVNLGELAGPWQVLLDGVEAGERVVVGDPASLKPGTPIDPKPFDGDAEALMDQFDEQQAEQAPGGAPAQDDSAAGEGAAGESAAGEGAAGAAAAEGASEAEAPQDAASATQSAQQAPMTSPGADQEAKEAEGEGNE